MPSNQYQAERSKGRGRGGGEGRWLGARVEVERKGGEEGNRESERRKKRKWNHYKHGANICCRIFYMNIIIVNFEKCYLKLFFFADKLHHHPITYHGKSLKPSSLSYPPHSPASFSSEMAKMTSHHCVRKAVIIKSFVSQEEFLLSSPRKTFA